MQKAAHDSIIAGLKSVDKRQGFRGPVKCLAEEEIASFCKNVEDGIDTASLKQGETYTGVVTGMNRATGDLTVRVGDRTGTLSRKNMAWAGRITLTDSYGSPGSSRSIPLGGVLQVQVLNPDENKSGAVFALDQEPLAQAALVAIDPATGALKALVGGYDFKKSQFNRAVQARRNAGSAFKPIIYAAALDKGMTPATVIDDSQVEYNGGGKIWKPKNYDNIYRGPVTMRQALTNSINVVSVKILEAIGVDYAIGYARKLGITSPLAANLTLALGSSSVTPLELTSAYAVFASGGYRLTPFYITKVTDGEGKVLEETRMPTIPTFSSMTSAHEGDDEPALITAGGSTNLAAPSSTAVPVISPETSFVMTNLMESVVTSGTGQRARALGRPVAGKTGTTNDMKDAWFIGYVPQLVAGVWVGYDQEKSLGAGGSGGQAAAPIWTEFMRRATAGLPVKSFAPPSGISFALINPKTGRLAPSGSEGAVQESFMSGSEPKSYEPETPPAEPDEVP
jgi:penicillin-binding protein 1A